MEFPTTYIDRNNKEADLGNLAHEWINDLVFDDVEVDISSEAFDYEYGSCSGTYDAGNSINLSPGEVEITLFEGEGLDFFQALAAIAMVSEECSSVTYTQWWGQYDEHSIGAEVGFMITEAVFETVATGNPEKPYEVLATLTIEFT